MWTSAAGFKINDSGVLCKKTCDFWMGGEDERWGYLKWRWVWISCPFNTTPDLQAGYPLISWDNSNTFPISPIEQTRVNDPLPLILRPTIALSNVKLSCNGLVFYFGVSDCDSRAGSRIRKFKVSRLLLRDS